MSALWLQNGADILLNGCDLSIHLFPSGDLSSGSSVVDVESQLKPWKGVFGYQSCWPFAYLQRSFFQPAQGEMAGYRNLRLQFCSLRCHPTMSVSQVRSHRPSWWVFLHVHVGEGGAIWEEEEERVSTSDATIQNSRRHQPCPLSSQETQVCESNSSQHLPLSCTHPVHGGKYFHRFLHQTVLRAEGFTRTPLPLDFGRRTPCEAERWSEHEHTRSCCLPCSQNPPHPSQHRALGARLARDVYSPYLEISQ